MSIEKGNSTYDKTLLLIIVALAKGYVFSLVVRRLVVDLMVPR